MTTRHTTEAAETRQHGDGHPTPAYGVRYTDSEGAERMVLACALCLTQTLGAHLDDNPRTRYLAPKRGAQCGASVPIEYELVIARRADRSGDGFEVYQVRVLEFLGSVGEYDTVEDFEVTIAPAADPELPGVHPRTVAFVSAVDIATRELDARGYTLTQTVTYKGGYGDGRVAK